MKQLFSLQNSLLPVLCVVFSTQARYVSKHDVECAALLYSENVHNDDIEMAGH